MLPNDGRRFFKSELLPQVFVISDKIGKQLSFRHASHEAGCIAYSKFLHDVGAMFFYGILADFRTNTDCFVCEAFVDEVKYLCFAFR